jgi:hypothetical protein
MFAFRASHILRIVGQFLLLFLCIPYLLCSLSRAAYLNFIATPTPTPIFSSQSFTGYATWQTPNFWLNRGTATIHLVYDGEREFEIEIWNAKRRNFESLAEASGHFDKTLQTVIKEGGYYFITTDAKEGHWIVTIEQP